MAPPDVMENITSPVVLPSHNETWDMGTSIDNLLDDVPSDNHEPEDADRDSEKISELCRILQTMIFDMCGRLFDKLLEALIVRDRDNEVISAVGSVSSPEPRSHSSVSSDRADSHLSSPIVLPAISDCSCDFENCSSPFTVRVTRSRGSVPDVPNVQDKPIEYCRKAK